MDLAQIHEALLSTLSPNQQQREAAEAALKGASCTPGYLTALFTIVSSGETKVEVRQAGAIYFKNLCLKHWENVLAPGEEPVRRQPIPSDHARSTLSTRAPSAERCAGGRRRSNSPAQVHPHPIFIPSSPPPFHPSDHSQAYKTHG